MDRHVVIVGGGFAGLNAAKILGNRRGIRVTLLDRCNYHLFQPLLYQVAMAGLSPAEIAVPIRTLLSPYRNIRVVFGEARGLDLAGHKVLTGCGELPYDSLLLACGIKHSYFGNERWEPFAPGLKTIEQATEIRRRVLSAFENAECESDPAKRRRRLTFVIVGGGPTGVELAGALGEMSRFTLKKDFRNIDPRQTRIVLLEAGPRILPIFPLQQSARAARDLEALGVQVWTSGRVTGVDAEGVSVGLDRIEASTVLWAAGVRAPEINSRLGVPLDPSGRVLVDPDLSIPGHPEVFVAGDQGAFPDAHGTPLPTLAPVAIQQGRSVADNILREAKGLARRPFHFKDKGKMATIGRNKAVAEFRGLRVNGFAAWLMWLFIHIYYLTGFRNRLFVILNWALAYLSFSRGARLIVNKEWAFFGREK